MAVRVQVKSWGAMTLSITKISLTIKNAILNIMAFKHVMLSIVMVIVVMPIEPMLSVTVYSLRKISFRNRTL